MATSNNLGFTLIEQAQSQKEVTANAALTRIDAILNRGASDKDLTTPPVSPSAGDLYIVAASATGDWASQDGKITYYLDAAWQFITPLEGMTIWVNDENRRYVYSNSAWVADGFINQDSGEFWRTERLEVTESALSGASVATSLQIPDRAIVFGVHSRVTDAITGATSFSVGDGTTADKFGSLIGVTLDSTNIGVVTPTPYFSATDIVLTPAGGNFTDGEVKLVMHYMAFRGPWSF